MRGRSFSLSTALTAIRQERDVTRRAALIRDLSTATRRDQDAFARYVETLGGRFATSLWTLNACVVEVTPAARALIAAHPLVIHLFPDDSREAGGPAAVMRRASPWMPPPADAASNGTDGANHAVAVAHSLLGHKGARSASAGGQQAWVAVFDTGVDADQTGTGTGADPDPHDAFRDVAGLSRIDWNDRAGSIDCNWRSPSHPNPPHVDPYCPNNSPYHLARHGTGVAGIAVGRTDTSATGPYFFEGHAAEARLLSCSITDADWTTSPSTLVYAVQKLQEYMLSSGGHPAHVLNISFHLWSDPDHITQLALDQLEREYDVLVIALAGNESDTTAGGPGFTNGLTVGNVHKFSGPTGRYPHRLTSRGPLFGDADRYFPDVCASGAGPGTSVGQPTTPPQIQHIVMPLIDYRSTTCNRGTDYNQWDYNAEGSSMSAPQVAGAAALYRADRASATAQETRAALLLATIDPFLERTPGADPLDTYVGRNSYGVGYVRDDLLARYARRLDTAVGQTVTVTPQNPDASVPFLGLTAGDHYAVVLAWPRTFPAADAEVSPWANVDLEVRKPTGELLARSDSTRNTHERAVFRAGNVTSATIHILGRELHGQTVPVYVAARRIGGDGTIQSRRTIPGYVARFPQDGTCTASVQEQQIAPVLPASYTQAYGSQPFVMSSTPVGRSDDPKYGMELSHTATGRTISVAYAASELGIDASVQPGQTAYRVRGLALRSWRPLPGCDTTLTVTEVQMARNVGLPLAPMPLTSPGGTVVAQNVQVPIFDAKWDARSWDTWPILIPLSQSFEVKAGENLMIWVQFAAVTCPQGQPNRVECDAIVDPYPALLAPYAARHSGFTGVHWGEAPVIGVLQGEPIDTTAELAALGFPVIGMPLLFQVRQAGGNSPTAIFLGSGNPSVVVGSCRLLTTADLGSLPVATTAPMGHATVRYSIPNDSNLLHANIYVQALVDIGGSGTYRYTNGLRLTIGGTLP